MTNTEVADTLFIAVETAAAAAAFIVAITRTTVIYRIQYIKDARFYVVLFYLFILSSKVNTKIKNDR